ncbi:hypothetical protein ARMGADRAFT_65606 [Armillaria gallica]|uniref:Uncharacterized protein n=1 Tax=Armillaria gallica TaxID=47427 RepID=A0A2H3DHQ4_ARMGA|nr:hypothetical protein ARMGADRAFT_65606 [Armillaria gallica]
MVTRASGRCYRERGSVPLTVPISTSVIDLTNRIKYLSSASMQTGTVSVNFSLIITLMFKLRSVFPHYIANPTASLALSSLETHPHSPQATGHQRPARGTVSHKIWSHIPRPPTFYKTYMLTETTCILKAPVKIHGGAGLLKISISLNAAMPQTN